MKKFLVSLIIGVTMMAIGTTMMVFELKEYEFVDSATTEDTTYRKETFQLKEGETLALSFEPSVHNREIDMVYDESLKDGEVKVAFTDNVRYELSSNKLVITDNRYGGSSRETNRFDRFIEGLKKHKVYVNYQHANIILSVNRKTSSEQLQISQGEIDYEYEEY